MLQRYIDAMKIIAHRGASGVAPENTLAAIRQAWTEGADGIEIDAHLTRDGEIAVIHDETTNRTTGIAGRVAEMDWAELRELDAGSWKAPKYAGERIPSLREAIAATPAGRTVFVEIKCGPEIIEPLDRLLKSARRDEDVILVGFDAVTMATIRKNIKPSTVYLNVEPEDWRVGLVASSSNAGFRGLSLGWFDRLAQADVAAIHRARLAAAVWCVDDAAAARKAQQWRVDFLMTNQPGVIREQL